MDIQMTKMMYQSMGIDEKVFDFGQKIAESLKERFEEIDKTAEYNQLKVIKAMQEARVSDIHFAGFCHVVTFLNLVPAFQIMIFCKSENLNWKSCRVIIVIAKYLHCQSAILCDKSKAVYSFEFDKYRRKSRCDAVIIIVPTNFHYPSYLHYAEVIQCQAGEFSSGFAGISVVFRITAYELPLKHFNSNKGHNEML